MEKLIECVPNFSEGQQPGVIQVIANEIQSVKDILLLNIDSGYDTNRTVMTFVGNPDAVLEAAFLAIKKAASLIDMQNQHGTHPRLGATDVCPLIPISGVTKEECIALSHLLAQRVGNELNIPVYLYGLSAQKPNRKELPDIRKGEYEKLANKMRNPDFIPDYGPNQFNPTAGATVIGVRDFMLAYNINLNTADAHLAKKIAEEVRTSGRIQKDKNGKVLKNEQGEPVRKAGKLNYCQARGWYIKEYGYAQVTMNLHNFHVTNLCHAFDAVCKKAEKLGLRVTGSEVIGMVPKKALLECGRYFLNKMDKNTGIPEKQILHTAIRSLGLSDTQPFQVEERIIEEKIKN
ncbi:MAG: glutamate formimidoyltransferase [Spirochaetes bacterium]|nr:glutamate formimidoyltransferase [Spirochaetota bacterium]